MCADFANITKSTTIVTIGPTGAGKSMFCNRFLRSKTAFVSSSSTRSETSETMMKETTLSYPDGSIFIHRAIDTPGIGDTQGRDWDFITGMINFLKELEGGVNLIVLVIPFGSRSSTDFHKTFKMLHVAFGNLGKLWDQTCLVITKCYYRNRKSWEQSAIQQSQEWKEDMRKLGCECTGDDSWNYDIPVFFVDSDMNAFEKSGNDEQMWNEPKVQEWLNECKELQIPPFRGWKQIRIKDKKLQARFNFTMFEEWAQSRPIIETKDLQIPQSNYFQQKSITEIRFEDEEFQDCEIQEIEEEYPEQIEHRVSGTQTEQIVEMVPMKRQIIRIDGKIRQPIVMKRKVMKFRTEKRVRMETREIKRKVQRRGFWAGVKRFFGSNEYDVITEKITVPAEYDVTVEYPEYEDYIDYIERDNIVEEEIEEIVAQVKVRETMKEDIHYETVMRTRKVLVKVEGIRFRKKEIHLTGRQVRNWEVKSQWSLPIWDQVEENILLNEFKPLH
jgi:hypothetical protein